MSDGDSECRTLAEFLYRCVHIILWNYNCYPAAAFEPEHRFSFKTGSAENVVRGVGIAPLCARPDVIEYLTDFRQSLVEILRVHTLIGSAFQLGIEIDLESQPFTIWLTLILSDVAMQRECDESCVCFKLTSLRRVTLY